MTTYYSGQLLTGPYDFPAYRFDSTRVFTNKPPCGPKRGHGSVQPRFAFEVPARQAGRASWSSTRSRSGAANFMANTRPSTSIRITRTASWSAWRRSSGQRLGDKYREAALRPRPRRGGLVYITGTNYPDLPQRDAAGGGAAEGSTARAG